MRYTAVTVLLSSLIGYAVAAPILVSIAPGATPGSFMVTIGSGSPTSCADMSTMIQAIKTGSLTTDSYDITVKDASGATTKNFQSTSQTTLDNDCSSNIGGSGSGSSGSGSSGSSGSSDSGSSGSGSHGHGSREGKNGGSHEGKNGKDGNGNGKNVNVKVKCFPPSATVQTNRGQMNMAEMYAADQTGLEVMTAGGQFSPVAFWLHAEPQRPAEFLRLTTADGQSLSLTAGHLVFKSACDRPDRQPIQAGKIAPGDCLLVTSANGQLRPQAVSAVEKFQSTGIFSPVTATGDLLVDNILASCYSEVESTRLQSLMFGYVDTVRSAARLFLPTAINAAIFGADGAQTSLAEVVTNFLALNDKFTA